MKTKYLVFQTPSGLETMVLFDGYEKHSDIYEVFLTSDFAVFKAVAGGFVNTKTGECFGESTSTKLVSRLEKDTRIAKQLLNIND